jgi:uncharacterized membrane-anchored protein
MRTVTKVAVLAVAQLALVAVGVAPQLSARATGDEYRLRVAPLDPIDPFRGAYVDLDYPDLSPGRDGRGGSPLEGDDSDHVYVVLVRDGDVWVADDYTSERPDGGVYLACSDMYWDMRCGIESWFLPQDEARAMESDLADGAIATVKIDSRGNAALVSVD